MKKRTLLVTATLTALVLSVGVVQPAPVGETAELTSHAQPLDTQTPRSAENPISPLWSYALGMEGTDALLFGITSAIVCSPFIWVGAFACSVTGAL